MLVNTVQWVQLKQTRFWRLTNRRRLNVIIIYGLGLYGVEQQAPSILPSSFKCLISKYRNSSSQAKLLVLKIIFHGTTNGKLRY